MTLKTQKELFEKNRRIYGSALLKFTGAEGFDVYNCSVPFAWEGKRYIFGRVERRAEWARSRVRLFECTGADEYSAAPGAAPLQLEDPCVSIVHGEILLEGTHVRRRGGEIDTFYGYFYRGPDPNDLVYFTTGPDFMKDIRVVELADGRIGVFSRPRGEEVRQKFGSASVIGFAVIDTLDGLTDGAILGARVIDGLFGADEWGGCNQAYLLRDGTIGVIGHGSYADVTPEGERLSVYVNTSFEFDPVSFEAGNRKIVASRSCYPACPAKLPALADCAFTSGIVMREDGRADLYSGVCDVAEGRVTIDYPFSKPLA